ncbi:MAG: hypothetical protein ACQEV6_15140 [Pseudomonadota bacterium]
MSPDFSLTRQAGAGLPVALFIITVLSLIVLGMSQLQQSTGNAVSLQIQSQRAFFAAESGMQLAVTEVLSVSTGTPVSCSSISIDSIDFDARGMSGCSAKIKCAEVGAAGEILLIESRGACGVGEDRATRLVEVKVR